MAFELFSMFLLTGKLRDNVKIKDDIFVFIIEIGINNIFIEQLEYQFYL